MKVLLKKVAFRTFCMFLWGVCSAWLFVFLEYTEKGGAKEKYNLLISLYKSMATKYNMSVEEFNDFSRVAHEALTEPKLKWTFYIALDFVFQTFTTIGFGYLTPQTNSGKILCMVVSLIGIPLTIIAFKSVGEIIAKLVKVILTMFEKKIFKRQEPKRVQIKSAVLLFILMVALLFTCGFLETLENLTFLEGFYMWFITLTTIGYGDYVPLKVKSPHFPPLPMNASSGSQFEPFNPEDPSPRFLDWLVSSTAIFGLCLVSAVLNAIAAAIEEHKWRPRCPRCIPQKIQNKTHDKRDNPAERCDSRRASLKMDGFKDNNITSLSQF